MAEGDTLDPNLKNPITQTPNAWMLAPGTDIAPINIWYVEGHRPSGAVTWLEECKGVRGNA